jgi:hypothetical protein
VEHLEQKCFGNAPLDVLANLLRNPVPALVYRWNWKSAVFSSTCRGAVFFFANLSSGVDAATGALAAEFLYRSISAGFYGALTQEFRKAEPRWAATLVALIVVPCVSHLHVGLHLLQPACDAPRGAGGGPWGPVATP